MWGKWLDPVRKMTFLKGRPSNRLLLAFLNEKPGPGVQEGERMIKAQCCDENFAGHRSFPPRTSCPTGRQSRSIVQDVPRQSILAVGESRG